MFTFNKLPRASVCSVICSTITVRFVLLCLFSWLFGEAYSTITSGLPRAYAAYTPFTPIARLPLFDLVNVFAIMRLLGEFSRQRLYTEWLLVKCESVANRSYTSIFLSRIRSFYPNILYPAFEIVLFLLQNFIIREWFENMKFFIYE